MLALVELSEGQPELQMKDLLCLGEEQELYHLRKDLLIAWAHSARTVGLRLQEVYSTQTVLASASPERLLGAEKRLAIVRSIDCHD